MEYLESYLPNYDFSEQGTIFKWVIRDKIPEELKKDRDFVLKMIQRDGSLLEIVSEEFKNDKNLILEADKKIFTQFRALEYASDEIKDDRDVVLHSVSRNGKTLKFASERLQNDKEIAYKAVENSKYAYPFVGKKLKDDKELALIAITNDNYLYQNLSKELQNDLNIILAATKNFDPIFEYATKYQDDKEVVLKIIDLNIRSLYYFNVLSERLRGDEEIFTFISEKLKSEFGSSIQIPKNAIKNRELALKMITKLVFNYDALSIELQKDKEIALGVLMINPYQFPLIPIEIQEDKDILQFLHTKRWLHHTKNTSISNKQDIILKFLVDDPNVLYIASQELLDNKEFILKCVKIRGCSISYASEKLKKDLDIVLAAVENDPKALCACPFSMRTEKVVRISCEKNPLIIQYVRPFRRNNKFMLDLISKDYQVCGFAKPLNRYLFGLKAVKKNGNTIKFYKDLYHKGIITIAVESNPECIQYLDISYLNDRNFALFTLNIDGNQLKYFPKFFRDKEVVMVALRTSEKCSKWIDKELLNDRDVYLRSKRIFDIQKENIFQKLSNLNFFWY